MSSALDGGTTIQMTAAQPFERFGGELPTGYDAMLAEPIAPDAQTLFFSHGRAALAWLLATGEPFSAALVAAYTCPTVPNFMQRRGLAVTYFDYGEMDFSRLAKQTTGRVIVLLPAPFGMAPWLDAEALARDLGERFVVVIDAAQSAFGHLEFDPPVRGAVLSCPRKALALGDGAALRFDKSMLEHYPDIAALPIAEEAGDLKQAARRLFALMDPTREEEALALVKKAEATLPDHACRMRDQSREQYLRTDRLQHSSRRLKNAKVLHSKLADIECLLPVGPGTPFIWPFAARGRDALISRLHAHRVFATPLWPDAVPGNSQYPRAQQLSAVLLALPIDQRYSSDDMIRMATLVRACL